MRERERPPRSPTFGSRTPYLYRERVQERILYLGCRISRVTHDACKSHKTSSWVGERGAVQGQHRRRGGSRARGEGGERGEEERRRERGRGGRKGGSVARSPDPLLHSERPAFKLGLVPTVLPACYQQLVGCPVIGEAMGQKAA